MLVRNRGIDPAVATSAFVAPTAALVGRVTVGPRARVMYGAVQASLSSPYYPSLSRDKGSSQSIVAFRRKLALLAAR